MKHARAAGRCSSSTSPCRATSSRTSTALDDVFLYDIDDLQHVVEQNRGEREKEAAKAEDIVDEELDEVRGWLRSSRSCRPSPRCATRSSRSAAPRRSAWPAAERPADEQRAQVEMLTASIVNKILHVPTVRMKEAAGRDECYLYVDAVRTLFGLDGSGAAEGEAPGDESSARRRRPPDDLRRRRHVSRAAHRHARQRARPGAGEWVRDGCSRCIWLDVEIEVVQTKGDKNPSTPRSRRSATRGSSPRSSRRRSSTGEVDLAVHSAKDMPTVTPDGLTIAVFTAREDLRDVFVAGGGAPARALADLPPERSSAPRACAAARSCSRRAPTSTLVDIRGNVQTRLRKVEDEGMAGTILAAAGLARLGMADVAAFAFSFNDMLPAVGQGSMASRRAPTTPTVRELVTPLLHEPTAVAVRAERALLHALEGGCQVPIAALGEPAGGDGANGLRLRAFVGSLDGTRTVHRELLGEVAAPEALGSALAAGLLAAGADEILREVRGVGGDG